jgi:hypothetical protein
VLHVSAQREWVDEALRRNDCGSLSADTFAMPLDWLGKWRFRRAISRAMLRAALRAKSGLLGRKTQSIAGGPFQASSSPRSVRNFVASEARSVDAARDAFAGQMVSRPPLSS